MYTKQPKKLLIMNILDILRRNSDAEHRLSQKDIVDILEREYNMTVERKAVKRNLMDLKDFGFNLECSESFRTGRNGNREAVSGGWYLEREFTDAELRLMIDSLLFSRRLPAAQCKRLAEKIKSLSNKYFDARVRHVSTMTREQPENPELFYTVEVLDEAIEQHRQVAFECCDYGPDKKLHGRRNAAGEIRTYVVNPYQMAAANGRYYLIGNMDKYDNVAHFRLDRIRGIRMLTTPAKPQRDVVGLENGLNLPKHMAEHVYMFSGESRRVVMKTTSGLVSEIIDWFGNDVEFTEEEDGGVIAVVTANLEAMRFWALQHCPYITVTEPPELAEKIRGDLRHAMEQYEK